MTHVFETFLAEDCVEEASDGRVVRHPVGFAQARQIGGGVVTSRFSSRFFERTRK